MKKIICVLIAVMGFMVVFAQDKKMTDIKTSQLPKTITSFISQNLPGATMNRAGKIEEKGVLSYYAIVEIKGQKYAYLFDKEGKFTGKGDYLFNGKGQAPSSAKTTTPKDATTGTSPAAKQQTTPVDPKK